MASVERQSRDRGGTENYCYFLQFLGNDSLLTVDKSGGYKPKDPFLTGHPLAGFWYTRFEGRQSNVSAGSAPCFAFRSFVMNPSITHG